MLNCTVKAVGRLLELAPYSSSTLLEFRLKRVHDYDEPVDDSVIQIMDVT